MYEFDLGNSKCVASAEPVIVIDGVQILVKDVIKLYAEVLSLREENVALNKDRSALQNINKGLQKQVRNYQDVIANNLTGIRCKELEGEVEQLKQQVSDLEEIIRDDMGAQSDEIYNLELEIDSLEKAYAELLGLFHGKLDEVKDQQAIIECQKNDIERLVKLNSRLISKQEDLKGAFYSILNR